MGTLAHLVGPSFTAEDEYDEGTRLGQVEALVDLPSWPSQRRPEMPAEVSVLYQLVGDMQVRVNEMEGRLNQIVSYVNPKLAPDDRNQFSGRAKALTDKLEEFVLARDHGDEVECFALRSSMRADLRVIRDSKGLHRNIRFAVGYVFDALTHTPLARIAAAQVDALRTALAVALGPSIPDAEQLHLVRTLLEKADFELFPPATE